MTASRPPVSNRSNAGEGSLERETITLRALDSGKTMDVVVLSKQVDRIQVMLGEGTHSVLCELKPTPDALAYVGSAMGREIVYEYSRAEVQADIDRGGPAVRDPNAR
jgi:hypothetical protein